MLCEYCHQTISSDMLCCPHCGAANPHFKEKRDTNVTINNTFNTTTKNVTVNNYNNYNINTGQTSSKKRVQTNQRQRSPQESPQELAQESKNTKLAVKCSFITTFVITILIGTDPLFTYAILYLFNFLGNYLLFSFLDSFKANKIVKLIVCAGIMIIVCVSCSSQTESVNESYDKTHDFQEFAAETQTARQYKTLPEKPQDGMSFAQLKKQKWGYKFLYTKCRDFDHLRPNKRYYEARWYDSDGNLIGKGLLNCQDEDDDTAILINFKDYTE